jgi:hypothetical protein
LSKRPTHISPEAAKLSQAPLLGEKAKTRAELQSLQGEIDRVARESKERQKLAATVEMQKVARQKAAKIARVAAAIEEERAPPPAPDNAPTRERQAKLLGEATISPPVKDKETRANTRVHEAHGVVEFYAGKWSYEQLQGARHLVQKWHETGIEPRITANYDGTPVSAAMFGPRSAGLVGKRRDAYTEWMQIEAITKAHFFEGGWNLIRWFVIETVRVAKEGATMTDQLTEAGRRLAPFVKDKERAWGVAIGSLQRIFEFAYGHFVVPKQKQREWEAERSARPPVRDRLNAKRMGKEQLRRLEREVDAEIAAKPKGLHVVKGGKT